MKKLYEIEANYYDAYDKAEYKATIGCTLEEAIEEIGFNNITLFNPYEEDTDKKDINNLYSGSYMVDRLSKEAKKVMVVLSYMYKDGDGFTCANIELKNKNDWKYFKDLVD